MFISFYLFSQKAQTSHVSQIADIEKQILDLQTSMTVSILNKWSLMELFMI